MRRYITALLVLLAVCGGQACARSTPQQQEGSLIAGGINRTDGAEEITAGAYYHHKSEGPYSHSHPYYAAAGKRGPQGAPGSPGLQGPRGFNGSDGAQGAQGFNGTAGAAGPQGFNGTKGEQGPQGFNGTQGPPGPGVCSSGRPYVSKSRSTEATTAACEAAYPIGSLLGTYKCATAKCTPGDVFVSGSCSTKDFTNPVFASSPLCADEATGDPVSCPPEAANIVGWACASQTSTTDLQASAVCCGRGLPRVLIVHAAGNDLWAADVKANLFATGAFSQVDLLNAQTATPTAAQLAAYGAVLTFSNAPYDDTNTLGDRLADYWDAGGLVVVAMLANSEDTNILGLRGRWLSGGYHLFDLVDEISTQESGPLRILEPNSPLVVGVANLTATLAVRTPGEVINGGVVVAEWGSGTPLIVRGVKNGRNLVSLNFYPPSSDARRDFWVGDGAAIMRNALLF